MSDGSRVLGRRTTAWIVVALLLVSLACIAIAPTLMPASYSMAEHSVSESAGQGIHGAWLARLGFLTLASAVFTLVGISGDEWSIWGRVAFRVYGACMIAVAAFAHSPWEDVQSDLFEDLLHSIAASGVGLSFTAGVLLVTLRRGPGNLWIRVVDWVAIIAAPVLPMIMFNITGVAGVVQRVLFGIGYLWFGIEAMRIAASDRPHASPTPRTTKRRLTPRIHV